MSRRTETVYLDPIEEMASFTITGKYLNKLVGPALVYLLFWFFWGHDILTNLRQLWGDGFVLAGLGRVWFIFVWAFALTLIGSLAKRHVSSMSRTEQTFRGLWLSLNAGVFEELIYRGFVFMSAMVGLRALDAIIRFLIWAVSLGHAHVSPVHWLYSHALVPLADWSTFHTLHAQLLYAGSWVFGAAIVSATGDFRSEHKYLGLLGWINSWFMGMVFFWLVFNYGLLTAIVAHFVYDAIIFTLRAVTSKRASYFSLSTAVRLLNSR